MGWQQTLVYLVGTWAAVYVMLKWIRWQQERDRSSGFSAVSRWDLIEIMDQLHEEGVLLDQQYAAIVERLALRWDLHLYRNGEWINPPREAQKK